MFDEEIRYQADGLDMIGRLFAPEAEGPVPGVLVFPEAFGLGQHAISRARRLAEMGYAALACDLHGNGARHTNLDRVLELVLPIRAEASRLLQRAQVPLEILRGRGEVDAARIASIGYCLGGTMSLELVRNGADIQVAAGFHAGLAPVSAGRIGGFRGKILMCIGADDPLIPPAERAAFEEEMRAAGTDWQLNLYGGVVHSFTDPEADARGDARSFRYDRHADEDGWRSLTVLLAETLA